MKVGRRGAAGRVFIQTEQTACANYRVRVSVLCSRNGKKMDDWTEKCKLRNGQGGNWRSYRYIGQAKIFKFYMKSNGSPLLCILFKWRK